jgi:hypothetical protein
VTSIAGETISLDDYRNRSNLVLVLTNGTEGTRLDDAIEAFATRHREYEGNDAQALVIASSAPETESAGSFPRVAVDRAGEVREQYASLLPEVPEQDQTLVFVLDRFATPHVAFATAEPADPALHAKIVSWLLGIELECPE